MPRASLQNSLRACSSLRITVVCLFSLFLLTFFGTLYQVKYGLYLSQKKFFSSWGSFWGPFPIPGAKLVLLVLTVNLLSDAVLNFRVRFRKMGLILVHWGILSLLFGSILLHMTVKESYVSLFEGEISNLSTHYFEWEICLWQDDTGKPYINGKKTRTVYAVGQESLVPGSKINYSNMGIQIDVLLYFDNARQTTKSGEQHTRRFLSATGIEDLVGIPSEKEPSENFPGAVVVVSKGTSRETVLLWGRELLPLRASIDGVAYCLQLRRKKEVLPVSFRLIDFVMETHPSSDIAKGYSSLIEIQDGLVKRKVNIFMNNPLRIGDRTFYQSSYEIRPEFPEKTVLSVVQGSGRLLLYISSLVICLGLFLHFVGIFFEAIRVRN